MDDAHQLAGLANDIADAISRRDADAVLNILAADFVARSPGGETRDRTGFADGIRAIPGEIVFVRLEGVAIDLAAAGALVTGIQHARVRLDGADIDDRRGFVDWFVKTPDGWRLQVAVDVPASASA